MKRISTNLPNMDMSYYMRLREWKLNQMQNKMASQSRIQSLRDDPLAAGHSTRYQSRIARIKRYITNVGTARSEMALIEGNLQSALDILHRIRELGVQGGNGIYTREQMAYMGTEITELLNELVNVANAKDGLGNYLFAGFRKRIEPFRVSTSLVEGSHGEVAASIEYVGDIGRNQAEISAEASIGYQIPGNYAFWAENQQIYSTADASEYRVQKDSAIQIDGVEINLKAGDNVYAIISKINDSRAPVKASLDPVKNSIVLETTFAHQIWPEDLGEGRVLQDLGIISDGNKAPPLNLSDSANVFGGSVFDMIMHVRDGFYKGDHELVGGSGLRGIDGSIEALTSSLAEIGSKDARLRITGKKLDYELPEYIRFNSEEVDLDLSKAITELKMLEYTHKAALATAARILPPTLLDFLR